MKTRSFVLIVLLVAFAAPAAAQSPFAGHYGRLAPAPAVEPGPARILKEGLASLIAFASAEPRPGRAQAVAFLESSIVPYFDFDYMARWAAGARNWERMGAAQQSLLENHIKQDFLATLATRLTGFGAQQFDVQRPRWVGDNEVVVGVVIVNPGAYPARLNFRFYRSPDGWKVFDVAANGSSAVMHYRREFRRMVMQGAERARPYYR
ncbi:MAG: ABC transporter substrate-binding protein [Gammaproteobacteria bacterium]|nr:ABC transporter substrate-binding protein [Gammaproteobacteria bacterium]